MSKKVGIFAGSFDPIHNGHMAFARRALDAGLEKVMFLPEPRPRRKQGVKSLEHRVAMVQLAVVKEPRFGTIVLEQARFTVHETLPVLQARFHGHKLVLMFGDDVISHIAGWPHVESLLNTTELMIASRHQDTVALQATLKTLEKTRNLKFDYQIITINQQDITSSKIRLSIKRGYTPTGLDPAIANYIAKHNLYASTVG